MKFRNLLLALIFLYPCIYIYGQETAAKATIDTNNVLIGDHIKLRLEVTSKPPTNIIWPQIPDTIGKLEVISRTSIDTLDTNGIRSLRQNLIITSFDSGYFELPQMYFMFEKDGMTDLYPATTEPMLLRFSTVPVDTAAPIKDIKPPLDIPFSIWDYITYIIIALAAALLIFAALYFFSKRKPKPKKNLDYDPKIPAHILALEALKKLDSEKLWQKGDTKLYYVKLTEIIRTYIERRFNIIALEMTSDEIIQAFRNIALNEELIEESAKMYRIADLVKFAKMQPLPDENSFCYNAAVSFVKRTIPAQSPDSISKSEEREK